MKAKWLVTSLVSAGLALPVAAFAWHGGSGWCAGYDGPGYGPGQGYGWHHWEDGPRHHARRAPAYDRHVYHHGARTFGMNETDAQEFMRDVAAVIHIGPKSQKAWDAMQTAYVDFRRIPIEKQNRDALEELLTLSLVCSNFREKFENPSLYRRRRNLDLFYEGSQSDLALIKACGDLGVELAELKNNYFKIETEYSTGGEATRTLVLHEGKNLVILKGAPEMGVSRCAGYMSGGEAKKMTPAAAKRLLDEAAQLSRESMTVYAVAAGVDPDCVFKDHAGLDTYSTMYRAKEIFQAEKVVVVTQAFHVSRAVYLARSLGLEAYGVACDRGEYTHKVRNELRETLARVKAVWSAVTQPEPKFLGDAIPIWGPGSATDDEYDRAESDGKEA